MVYITIWRTVLPYYIKCKRLLPKLTNVLLEMSLQLLDFRLHLHLHRLPLSLEVHLGHRMLHIWEHFTSTVHVTNIYQPCSLIIIIIIPCRIL